MLDKPSNEWTREEWDRLRREAYALSDAVLDAVQNQPSEDGTFSVQVAGYALLIAMGRLSGKFGFRNIPFEEVWGLWTDDAAKRQVQHAFDIERRSEN
jgi:hypothetical protein